MPNFAETYLATVAPEQCDHLGHMNVQHYFAAVSDGMFALMSQIGLTRSEIMRRKMSFAVVQAESRFLRELVAGDVVRLRSSVRAVGGKSATFLHQLVRLEDGSIAFETVFTCVLLHLDSRKGIDLPEDVREKLSALQGEETASPA